MKSRNKTIRKVILLLALVVCIGLAAVRGGRLALHRFVLAEFPREYSEFVEPFAEEYGLDPLLIYAFIRTESGFDPAAQSNVDARGLMQITEETFDWIKSKIARDEALVFEDLYDPAVNVRFGTYYLDACLDRYQGDVATAAAAYHSGWGTVDKLLAQEEHSPDGKVLTDFPYTQMGRYVIKIDRHYRIYQRLYAEPAEK